MKQQADAYREAIVALVPQLRAFARFLARDVTRADDLVQDTVLRALERQDAWAEGTDLRAWTCRIEARPGVYGILPGDLKDGLPPIEIASTPVPAPVAPPQLVPASVRRSPGDHRKALPVRPAPGQTAAAPGPGVRRVASE